MKRGLWIGAAILVAAAAAIPLWLVVDDGGDRRAGAVAREDNARGFGFYVEKAAIQSAQ